MTTDRVAGVALALVAVVTLWQSHALPLGSLRNPGPAYMPVLLALLLLGLGLAVAALGGRAPKTSAAGWQEWPHAVAILGVCAFAALGLERLGYRLTLALGLAFLLGVVERKRAVVALAFAIAFAAGSFLLFDTLLRVPLPRGPLGL